jgi:hypothetical protein
MRWSSSWRATAGEVGTANWLIAPLAIIDGLQQFS